MRSPPALMPLERPRSAQGSGSRRALTGEAQTVTVTAQDADTNRAAGDRDTLTFQVTVFDNPTLAAGPTAANPAPPPVV